MSRGGYLVIIGCLMLMFGYQNYSNEKMLDRYEKVFSAEKNQVNVDTTSTEIASIKDSLMDLNVKLASMPKTSDTVIKKTYVNNTYVISPPEIKTSAENDNIEELMLTKSD